jgi:hypothetical protein
MLVTSRVWNASLGQMVTAQTEMNVKMRSTISTYADLKDIDKAVGDIRITLDTQAIYVWDGNTWLPQGHLDADSSMINMFIQSIS